MYNTFDTASSSFARTFVNHHRLDTAAAGRSAFSIGVLNKAFNTDSSPVSAIYIVLVLIYCTVPSYASSKWQSSLNESVGWNLKPL